ncbi:MAG TPA: hypothetical protein VMG82_32160 [Candidatus Sulfotelmatobacter sp.]|nr:hypothetical protein [Candidatus Sulfotelmatobacter sp.]
MTVEEGIQIGVEAGKLLDEEFAATGTQGDTCQAVAKVMAARAARTPKVTAAVPTRLARPMSKATWDFLIYR